MKRSDSHTKALIAAITETSHDAFVAIDSDGRIAHWNTIAENIFGWARAEALGRPMAELIIPVDQRHAHSAGMSRYRETGRGKVVNRRIKMTAERRTGERFPVEMTISEGIEDGELIFFAFIHDSSERQQAEAELLHLARTDMLTQLPNRRYFIEQLDAAMARAKRHRRTMAVFFMDIDRFKTINDSLGHETGDVVLQEFARRLRMALREVDFAARLGGDEFIVIAEDIDLGASAAVIAQKIIESMRAPFDLDGRQLKVTTSIGVARYSGEKIDASALIRRADQALYQAKRSGRNAFRIAEDNPESPELAKEATPVPLVQFVAKAASQKLDLHSFMQESLSSIRRHLGMDVAFISQFLDGRRFFRAVDSEGDVASIEVGGSDPLEDSYCQRVVDGRLPELMPDAFENQEAMSLPATAIVPVRAHLSVPIRLSNGEIYGTYCCFSHTADQSLNDRDLGMLRVFADFLAKQIEIGN